MSHDERHQAGANARSVLVSTLVLRRSAQVKSTEASSKGCYILVQRDQDHEAIKMEVTVEPKTASPPESFAGEDYFCQDKLY